MTDPTAPQDTEPWVDRCGHCGHPLTGDTGYSGSLAYHRNCARLVYGDQFHEDGIGR